MSSVKIRENKTGKGMESARFYISYLDGHKNLNERIKKSYELISALAGEGDMVVELKSTLLGVFPAKREDVALEFLKGHKSATFFPQHFFVPNFFVPNFLL